MSAKIVILLAVLVILAAAAFLVSTGPRTYGETAPDTADLRAAEFAADYVADERAVSVSNFGKERDFYLYIDGTKASTATSFAGGEATILILDDLMEGEHTLLVVSGDEYVEKTINVGESWVAQFTITASR